MRLEHKICAITGAGGGIGRVAADIFAKEGATVLILELNEVAANKAAEEICTAGGNAKAYPVDISNEAAVADVLQKSMKSSAAWMCCITTLPCFGAVGIPVSLSWTWVSLIRSLRSIFMVLCTAPSMQFPC